MYIKFDIQNSLGTKSGKMLQNGMNSYRLSPMANSGSLNDRINSILDGSDNWNNMYTAIANITNDANNIKNTVINLSDNLNTIHLSDAVQGEISSAITESTATFVTDSKAGGWYGLSLETDVNGTKYITGFDIGAIVDPSTQTSDSYFRISADRFIVGGDLGDGQGYTGPTAPDGSPLPAFSIDQSDGGQAEIYFNGKVNISSLPESVTKLIGKFADINELNIYLLENPEILVKDGDSYLNTTENVLYFWNGNTWISAEAKLTIKSLVFKRSRSKPITPTGGSYQYSVPDGWSDGIPEPTFDIGTSWSNLAVDPVWVSIHMFDNKTDYTLTEPIWSEPLVLVDSEYNDFLYSDSATTPVTPTYSGNRLDVQSEDSANGWYNSPSVNSIWGAHRSRNVGVSDWSSWTVYRIKGESGEPGNDGAQGARGSTIARIYSTSNSISYYASNTHLLTNAIYAIVTPDSLQKGDQVIVTASDGTEIFEYNSGWTTNTALRVNGNAIIDGTLAVDKIASGSTAIGGGTFSMGTGSSVTYAGINFSGILMAQSPATSNGIGGVSYTGFGIGGGSYLGPGVAGGSQFGIGVYGKSVSGNGIRGESDIGYAGYFIGPVTVTGSLSVSGSSITGNTITGSYISSSGNITGSGYCSINGYINTNTEFRKNGAFLAFTGGHITYSDSDIMLGDILYVDSVVHANIAQTFQKVYSTTTPMDKRVFGIAAVSCSDIEGLELVEFWCKDPETDKFRDGGFEDFYNAIFGDTWYNIYKTNSIGEGQMNVCAANGDIANGDYICSSVVRGKGMKQDDDILHNYTVAKALENVIWDAEVVGEGGCFEQDGYKCKMIACTYHAG